MAEGITGETIRARALAIAVGTASLGAIAWAASLAPAHAGTDVHNFAVIAYILGSCGICFAYIKFSET